jgi:hypothetical protein
LAEEHVLTMLNSSLDAPTALHRTNQSLFAAAPNLPLVTTLSGAAEGMEGE